MARTKLVDLKDRTIVWVMPDGSGSQVRGKVTAGTGGTIGIRFKGDSEDVFVKRDRLRLGDPDTRAGVMLAGMYLLPEAVDLRGEAVEFENFGVCSVRANVRGPERMARRTAFLIAAEMCNVSDPAWALYVDGSSSVVCEACDETGRAYACTRLREAARIVLSGRKT